MRDFNNFMGQYQENWRRKNIKSKEQGYQKGVQRPWILPSALWEENLWDELRSTGKWPVSEYLSENSVQRHTGSHNLKSSWISGVNFYFPFGQTNEGRALLSSFLRARLNPGIESIQSLELEYAEGGRLSPRNLLGEDGGSRGQGQTSPDIALLINHGAGLILIENKLTEHSFYPCSARITRDSKSRPGNPDKDRCFQLRLVLAQYSMNCHQHTWGRKYWELLRAVINEHQLGCLKCCPAALGGYQLFRQQALAEGIARSGKYSLVMSCIAIDQRNEELRKCLSSTGIDDISGWGNLFKGKASFGIFTHQDWFNWVKTNSSEASWSEWIKWIKGRYGMA